MASTMQKAQLIKLDSYVKRIGILSDSHGHLDERILSSLNDVDIIIHAGDIMDNCVINKLKDTTKACFFVTGNNDTASLWSEEHKTIVKKIPESLILEIDNNKIGIIHGHQFGRHQPDHKLLRNKFEECRLIIYGHTHKQIIDNQHSPWVINPGASGKIRTRGGVSCLLLNIEEKQWNIQTIKYID